jgi:hypothetical protein
MNSLLKKTLGRIWPTSVVSQEPECTYTVFAFGECGARMGSPDPYLFALNDKQEVFSAPISLLDFNSLAEQFENIDANEESSKILKGISFKKSGLGIKDYPMQRLLGSGVVEPGDNPLVFCQTKFKKGDYVDAGMGNFGIVLGSFALTI